MLIAGFLVSIWAAPLNQNLLSSTINGEAIEFCTLACWLHPSPISIPCYDNSGTKKELVGRPYTLPWPATALLRCTWQFGDCRS